MSTSIVLTDQAIEAARRAMVKWDCDDTKRWLMKRWGKTAEQAQAIIAEGLRDLGGSTGTRELARVMLEAALPYLGRR